MNRYPKMQHNYIVRACDYLVASCKTYKNMQDNLMIYYLCEDILRINITQ